MTSARISINLREGIFELEGDAEFIREHLDKVLPLVSNAPKTPSSPPGRVTDPTPRIDSDEGKRTRKAARRAPPGATCRDRILTLKAADFFKTKRGPSDVASGLGEKGWTHSGPQVRAALSGMFDAGELQRTKNSDGRGFLYFWDRD